MKTAQLDLELFDAERAVADIELRRGQELISYEDLSLFGIPYSRQHIQRLIAGEIFPKPVRIGLNRVAFRRSDILKFINNLKPSPARRSKRRA